MSLTNFKKLREMKCLYRKYQWIILVSFLMLCSCNNLKAQVNKGPVRYSLEVPQQVKRGEQFIITAVFSVQPNWYIYAPIEFNTAQGKIVTKVSFRVPEKLKTIGPLELPKGAFGVFKGNNIRMSQKFEVEKNIVAGKYLIKANIIYQTCNDEICFPPIRETVDLEIQITD